MNRKAYEIFKIIAQENHDHYDKFKNATVYEESLAKLNDHICEILKTVSKKNNDSPEYKEVHDYLRGTASFLSDLTK